MARARGLPLAYILGHPRFRAEGARRALLDRVGPETRAALEAGPCPAKWYPETMHLEAFEAVTELLELEEDCAYAFFRDGQAETLRGGGRTRLQTLPAVLAQVPVLWQRNHDTGRLSVTRRGRHSLVATLAGHPFAGRRVYRIVVAAGLTALVSQVVTVESWSHWTQDAQNACFELGWA